MTDRNVPETPRPTLILTLILILLTIPPTTFAQPDAPSTISCSIVDQTDGISDQFGVVSINQQATAVTDCTPPPGEFVDIPAGSPFTIWCFQYPGGATVLAPTALTINLVLDNTGFGSLTPTSVRSIDANSCIGAQVSFSAACTQTGVVGAAAYYGILRIHIRQTRTGVGAYDRASDSDTWSIMRCTAGLTSLSESNAQTTYVGGDTIGLSYATNATSYDATNTMNGRLVCGSQTYNLASDIITTASRSKTTTILGSPTAWQTGCSIAMSILSTRFSAVSGYSTVHYLTWSGNPPSGVTFSAPDGNGYTTATITSTKPLNRILTPTGTCGVIVNAASSTVGNRNDWFNVSTCGPWQDARNTNVPNNQPARAWYQRNTNYRVTTDFPSTDLLFDSQGGLASAIQATTSATVTSALGYHKMVEEFSTTARTDAVLMNWGNTSGILDVSASWTFDGITVSKTSLGANTSTFTIGADLEFAHTRPLKGANGALLVGFPVTCQRTKPDLSLEASVLMGNSNAQGESPEQAFQVLAPQGTWKMDCTSGANGNTGQYRISFFHVSAFTADISVSILWNVTTYNGTHLNVNLTTIIGSYNPASDSVVPVFPDGDVRLSLVTWNTTLTNYSNYWASRALMTRNDGITSSSWYTNVLVPVDDLSLGGFAGTWLNISGRPFVHVGSYIYQALNDSTLESRSHANSTWETQTHANSTWESQAHANSTWCLQSGCNFTGTIRGNFSGNFTGNVWGNLSGVFLISNVTVPDGLLHAVQMDAGSLSGTYVLDEISAPWERCSGSFCNNTIVHPTASGPSVRDNAESFHYDSSVQARFETTNCGLNGTIPIFSVAGWVHPDTTTNGRWFSASRITAGTTNFEVSFDSDNMLRATFGPGTASYLGAGPSPGVWTHYVMTYDGTQNRFLVYRDSALVLNVSPSTSVGTFQGHCVVGTTLDHVGAFDGSMAQFRIYNRALTQSDIIIIYNQWTLSAQRTISLLNGEFLGASNVSSTTYYGDGSHLTGIDLTGVNVTGANLTIAQTSFVIHMADFFSSPNVVLAPYVLMIVLTLLMMGLIRGFLPSFIMVIMNFLGLFSLAGSKADLDAMGPYYTPILAIVMLALVVVGLAWSARCAMRDGMMAGAGDSSRD